MKRSSKNAHNELMTLNLRQNLLVNIRSMRETLFHLKQIESSTTLVKLKMLFRSEKCLDESEVSLKVFIFKSPAKTN